MTQQRAPRLGLPFASRAVAVWICAVVGLVALSLSGCEEATSTRSVLDVALWPTGQPVDVVILDETSAIVVSDVGTILRSTDRGDSWSRMRVPAVEGLAGLAMVSGERGWAVGAGVVLRTDDGGQSWVRQRLPGRASSLELQAVAARSRDEVIALGQNGRRLRSEDGGGVWIDLTESGDALRADLRAIACESPPDGACLAVGSDMFASADGGRTWAPVPLEDAAGLPLFRFRLGGVELDEAGMAQIREAALRLTGEPVSWRVEAFVSAGELDRVAGDRDPNALFELLSARTEELVGALEAAGVDPDRIVVEGAPPWGYEDHIDDDPDFLSRYWQGRLAAEPGARAEARLALDLASVAIRQDGGVIVVGDEGRVLEANSIAGPFRYGESPGPHALLDLAVFRGGEVVVGRQGVLRVRRKEMPEAALTAESKGWETPAFQSEGAFFEALRAVDMSEAGDWGLAVGDAGRVLRSEDSGQSWVSLTP